MIPGFGVLILGVGALLVLYVVARAATVPIIARRFPSRTLALLAMALWAGLVLSRTVGHDGEGALAAAVELAGMTALAVLFLTATALAAVDLLTAFGLLFRRQVPALRGGALVLGAALSVVALIQGLRPPVVRDHEVHLHGLPRGLDGTVVVALSDVHLGNLLDGGWLSARVAQIRALRPDLVVLLGDIFEGHGPAPDAHLWPLAGLRPPLGLWAVTGNHEFRRGNGEFDRRLGAVGVRVLHDEWAPVRPGLLLAGVDDLTSRRRAGLSADFVGRALAARPPGATVLLSHTPWGAEAAAAAGAGLMLAGHTHGGQIWPFGYLVRRRYPLLAGRYDVGGMPVIVTRGVGTWGPRMRLWRPGEILRITLHAA